MKKQKDYVLLSHFRANARNSLTTISRRTSIPVSTIFDKLRDFEEHLILKHTTLLDFRKLGFELKAHILFKVSKDQREAFQRFLFTHAQVNSVYRVNNGYDFLVEGIFRGLKDLDQFFEDAANYSVEKREEFFVLEDLMREEFLSHKQGFEEVFIPALGKEL